MILVWAACGLDQVKTLCFRCWSLFLFQLIIATVPDPKHGKSPSIVTDDNIQLLFDIQNKVTTMCYYVFLILYFFPILM